MEMKTLRWLGAILLLLSAVCVLAWWNMPVAEFLLKLIEALLIWPTVIALVLIYFMRSQRDVLGQILTRLTDLTSWKVAFPGGALEATKYPPAIPPEKEKLELAQAKNAQPKEDEVVTNFGILIVEGMDINQNIIAKLLDRIIAKQFLPMFRPEKTPAGYLEKVAVLQGKLDQQAIADLTEIEEILKGKKKVERSEIVRTYLKSQKLVWYLSDIALRQY